MAALRCPALVRPLLLGGAARWEGDQEGGGKRSLRPRGAPGGLQHEAPPVPILVGVTDYAKGNRGPGKGVTCPGSRGAQPPASAV